MDVLPGWAPPVEPGRSVVPPLLRRSFVRIGRLAAVADQRLQLGDLGGVEIGERRTDGARMTAHGGHARLDDRHRVATLAVADRDVGQHEIAQFP